MNNKGILIGIIVLLILGTGYWFYSDSQKQGEANKLAQAGSAQDTNSMQVGGEVAPGNDPAMNGTWKSKEDAKFTREFNADGTVTDRYEGDASATMTGTYMLVDASLETDIPVPAANLSGMKVIKTTWPDGTILYFGVQSLTATDLALINLSGRGNILTFTKVQ
ncbi:hypothetical protein A2765_06540 [Candidatus Kaiserbacteria bacterium RIFCSPHIGHO2_01_FULL_56_24]|uniref:Uncharacterized protein n=1 Tax=Candidatus Kaiserbacteria bacterium RIFCSPHIGHO2_01_FULL_56_24 TaxID=1798487 RepID=A0A1F6D9N9_9BACT|nr:MAG: hypothetical protein A2765_06540 [Candidatus Kaiserbacteria bacterium RIFCSPHIGHO2_01_FULL_56_24]